MTKQELVRRIAADAEATQRDVNIMLDSFMEIVMDTVASGEKVQLVGFGSFEPKHRAARIGRNPQTKEPVDIPAATVPVFHAGTIFKEKIGR